MERLRTSGEVEGFGPDAWTIGSFGLHFPEVGGIGQEGGDELVLGDICEYTSTNELL